MTLLAHTSSRSRPARGRTLSPPACGLRLFYGQPSSYCWWDATGACRTVPQGEGCEQGDPLAPALFALGQHEALCQAAAKLHRDDALLAFLDDLYVVTVPELARAALDSTTTTVETHCGIASNLGKTRAFTLGETPPPPGISELGAAVWRGDKPPPERGLVVLSTPIGHPEFVRAWAAERMQEERKLLEQLPELPDLQCSWLLLSMCASTRANHALRTLPPSESRGYAAAHDAAIWETLQACLGGEPLDDAPHAWPIATLPAVLGGLGLQSAQRTAPAAYWAAWADALPVMRARAPDLASRCREALEGGPGRDAPCLREAVEAGALLREAGWQTCPTWSALLDGVRPPPADDAGPGDWPHGWQMRATRTLNTHFRERTLLPDMPPSSQALLRSQAGPQAGAWLAAIPTEPATTLPPMAMQIAFDHALACPRTGLLARRAKIVERAWVQVARAAVGSEGQVVPQPWLANTTAPQVGAQDRRRLDLVVYGALRSGGAQCCDATLVSPLTRSGHPQPCAAAVDGAVLRVAERRKHAAYPELTRGGPQTLVVLGSEVGGRWNAQARGFVRDLVRLKAYRAPLPVRAAATAAWARRSMLSVAVQQAVASTALGGAWRQPLQPEAGEGPPLDSVIHHAAPEGHSRLPLRP